MTTPATRPAYLVCPVRSSRPRHRYTGAPCYRDAMVALVLVLLGLVALLGVTGCGASGPSNSPNRSPSYPTSGTTTRPPSRPTARPTARPTVRPVPPRATHRRPVKNPPGPAGVRVLRVVDGDTIRVSIDGTASNSRAVRLIGIDTPERGCPGYREAKAHLARLIGPVRVVVLTGAPGRQTDRYQRLLRYVSAGGRDAGLALIAAGHAVARYDSREPGYKWHPREASYHAAQVRAPRLCRR